MKFRVVYDEIVTKTVGRFIVEVEAESEEDAREMIEMDSPESLGLKPVKSGEVYGDETASREVKDVVPS